jgi:hypothetical protein
LTFSCYYWGVATDLTESRQPPKVSGNPIPNLLRPMKVLKRLTISNRLQISNWLNFGQEKVSRQANATRWEYLYNPSRTVLDIYGSGVLGRHRDQGVSCLSLTLRCKKSKSCEDHGVIHPCYRRIRHTIFPLKPDRVAFSSGRSFQGSGSYIRLYIYFSFVRPTKQLSLRATILTSHHHLLLRTTGSHFEPLSLLRPHHCYDDSLI